MNPLAEHLKKAKETISEIEAGPDDHGDLLQAIKFFCQECPLVNDSACLTCYLNPWK